HAGGAPFGELTVVAAPRRCRYSLAPDASIGRSRRPVRERQARTILPRDVDVIANAQQEAWELPARAQRVAGDMSAARPRRDAQCGLPVRMCRAPREHAGNTRGCR